MCLHCAWRWLTWEVVAIGRGGMLKNSPSTPVEVMYLCPKFGAFALNGNAEGRWDN